MLEFLGWELGWQFQAVEDNCFTLSNSCPQLFMKLATTFNLKSYAPALHTQAPRSMPEPITEPRNTRNTPK